MIGPLAGLTLGLAGSLHCVGMCGPIALALPGKRKLSWNAAGTKMWYQAGRVTSYTMLGALAGYGGEAVVSAGFAQSLSIVSGILMILTAIVQLVLHKNIIPATITDRVLGPLHRLFSRALRGGDSAIGHYGIGLVNGLLPCGLVMSALMGAIGTGSATEGALFMSLFGLGTVPLMSAVAILGVSLSCKLRNKLRYATPAVAIIIGIVFIFRGMSLNIPYLSPAIVKGKPACCSTK
jgi:sulfite exporter TauE/SafE